MISRKFTDDNPIVFPDQYPDFEKALNVLKGRYHASGIPRILKDKHMAVKRSDIKRLKHNRAARRRARWETRSQ